MGQFKEYMLQEGECWDAVCHGFSKGWKAYRDKRDEQNSKTEIKKLTEKIKNAKSEDLKDLVNKIVDKDLTVNKQGEVQQPPKTKSIEKWLTEDRNVRSQRKGFMSKDLSKRS